MSLQIAVEDSASLLRRIHPSQVIHDQNTGLQRPSSAAFKDPDLSVDVEDILVSLGMDWHFSLRDYPGYSLVRFTAQVARAKGQAVILHPLPENPAHAQVEGKKSPGVANTLRDASTWVSIADSVIPFS
jgi:hypothetical protein